jgi:hypothetical protein
MKLKEIACFISPHGFGHATRAVAVLEALQHLHPNLHPHVFTTVPRGLLAETLSNFTYHSLLVDIGLIQTSALDADIDATINKLDSFLPFSHSHLESIGSLCNRCSFVLCDIAPFGIAVARHLGIPSVLVENFTWDWIYEPHFKHYPKLGQHAQFLQNEFEQADYHIRTEPLCQQSSTGDLICGPIFRKAKGTSSKLRNTFNCGRKKIILITMGGIPMDLPIWKEFQKYPELLLICTGQKETRLVGKNILHLKRKNGSYHPDLICAADLVVCKAGYSTVAECCQAGTRVISVGRSDFPESEVLQSYIKRVLGGVAIDQDTFLSGKWLSLVPHILTTSPPAPATENGADVIASFLLPLL